MAAVEVGAIRRPCIQTSSPTFTTAVTWCCASPEPGPTAGRPSAAFTPSRNRAPPTPPTSTVTFTAASLRPRSEPACSRACARVPGRRSQVTGRHTGHDPGRARLPAPPAERVTSRGSRAGSTAGRSGVCGTRTAPRTAPPAPAAGRTGPAPRSIWASSIGWPSSAQPTSAGMWKSPTLTASGSPQARCAISAAVHTPIPGTRRSSSRPASPPSVQAFSSRWATAAQARIARRRAESTPARCHSQSGTARICAGRRRDAQARGDRARGGVAEAAAQLAPRPARLGAGDLLLQHRGHQHVPHPAGGAEPDARHAPVRVGHQRVVGDERAPGRRRRPAARAGRRATTPRPGPTRA